MMPPRREVSAWGQVLVLAWICFCGPGLFNALLSMASGIQDPTLAFRGNMLIYVVFTLASAVAGGVLGVVGLRRGLLLGSLGYVLYIASLWNLQTRALAAPGLGISLTGLYYVACGALGAAAGLLWATQGQMIMSYSTAANQGRYLGTFWIIFNLGATCGGLLAFAVNFSQPPTATATATAVARVSDWTFVLFGAIAALATVAAYLWIAPPSAVVKDDGQPVALAVDVEVPLTTDGHPTTWHRELGAMGRYLASAPEILLLLPLFAYSNWFYTYHSFYNVSIFNARTGGLASALYWTAQMLSAHVLGGILDRATSGPHSKPLVTVARRVLGFLVLVWNAMWALGWLVQGVWVQPTYARRLDLDIADDLGELALPLGLYVVYGAADALGQVWIYWFLGSVCPRGKCVRVAGYHAGLYKSVQALSAAVAAGLGARGLAPATQLGINWFLANVGALGALGALGIVDAAVPNAAKEPPGRLRLVHGDDDADDNHHPRRVVSYQAIP